MNCLYADEKNKRNTLPAPYDHLAKITAKTPNRSADNTFDLATLNEIRHTVHPLYSTVPQTTETREELSKRIKIGVPDRARGKGPRGTTSVTFTPTTATNRGVMLPIPKLQYAHAKGCNYSSAPDVVIKSAAAVEAMDESARAKLESLRASLNTDVDLRGLTSDPDAWVGAGSLFASTYTPGAEKDTDTDQDTDTDTEIDMDDANTNAAAAFLKILAWEEAQESRKVMLKEEKRLEEWLGMSVLAKGLYLKRCNGEYRNVADDVLVMGEAENGGDKGDASLIRGEGDGDDDGLDFSDNTSNDTATTDSQLGATASSTPPSSTSTSTSTSEMASSPVSRASSEYGYTVPAKPNQHMSTITTTTNLSASDSDFSTTEEDRATTFQGQSIDQTNGQTKGHIQGQTQVQAQYGPAPTLPQPQTVRFTSAILMSREALVRAGTVDDENLCSTCWAYSRMMKPKVAQAHAPVQVSVSVSVPAPAQVQDVAGED